jgi:hypothetical protein
MIGPWFYAGLLVLLVAAWPLVLAKTHQVIAILVALLNFGLLAFVWRSCSTPTCSYWRGLNIIAGSIMSGCANITLLYAPIVLAVVYLISIIYAVQGFLNEQRAAGPRWEQLVLWFYNHRPPEPLWPPWSSRSE